MFVRFLGWYNFDLRLHIISEYCELGDLTNYLEKHNGRLPEDQVSPASFAHTNVSDPVFSSFAVIQHFLTIIANR